KIDTFLLGNSLRGTLTAILLTSVSQLCTLPAFAQTASGDSADGETEQEVVITDKARSHFRAGVNLLQDPDGARYEEAYAQFKAAYAESPSWKILNNFGITAMKLERDGEAIDAFQKYLDEGGQQVSAEEREQTQRDLDTLKASIVTVTVKVEPSGVRLTDERITNRGGNITNQYALDGDEIVLRIRPGSHRITAHLSGYESSVWEINAQAGSSHEHAFILERPKAGVADGAGEIGRAHV